jgi:hypothetical protein
MNRRQIVKAIVASGLTGWLAPSARAERRPESICVKHIDPAETFLWFSVDELAGRAALRLKPSGNALWINSLRWQDADAVWHHLSIRRNLAPEKPFPLQFDNQVQTLEFSITTLPLMNKTTIVTLLA